MSCAVESMSMVSLSTVSPVMQTWLNWLTLSYQWWVALLRPVTAWPQPRTRRPHQPGAARAMYLRALTQFEMGDVEAALSLAHAARDLYARTDDGEGLGRAERLIGDTLAQLQQYDSAADAYRRATVAFKQPENDAETYIELAEVARLQGHLDEAQAAYQQARKVYHKLGDRIRVARLTQQVAYVLYEQERWAEAEGAYREALSLADELRLTAYKDSLLLEIGNAVAQQGRILEARSLFEQSAAQAGRTSDLDTLADALHSLATTYAQTGLADAAIPLYRESLSLNRRIGDRIGMAYTLYELGVLEGERGQTERARRHLQAALRLYEEEGATEAEVARWTLDHLSTTAYPADHTQALPTEKQRPLVARRSLVTATSPAAR